MPGVAGECVPLAARVLVRFGFGGRRLSVVAAPGVVVSLSDSESK